MVQNRLMMYVCVCVSVSASVCVCAKPVQSTKADSR